MSPQQYYAQQTYDWLRDRHERWLASEIERLQGHCTHPRAVDAVVKKAGS
jgi:hypothetical protein